MANETPSKLRVMVDANVLFAGIVWPRFPYEVLRHAVMGDYQLLLSATIIEEARTAIMRVAPETASRFSDVLAATQYQAVPAPTKAEITANSQLVRDSKDIHVALAAINTAADYLISQDKDLTEPTEPIHQRLKVLLPGTFLRHYMGWSSEALEAIRTRNWEDLTDN